MSSIPEKNADSAMQALLELIENRFPSNKTATVSEFVQQYYRDMPAEDLQATPTADLYGAALSHWNFAGQRDKRTSKIHVYNPQPEQHGWQSTHTIIDIVTDDRPFLVDSLSMALDARGLPRYLLLHPVLKVRRDADGNLIETTDNESDSDVQMEAWMHFEIVRQTEREALEDIRDVLMDVLHDVAISVDDWRPMCKKLQGIIDEIKQSPPALPKPEIDEGVAFLEWIADNHFTFLGYREYELVTHDGQDVLRSVANSGLGILRNPGISSISSSFGNLPARERRLAHKRELLIITKSNGRSPVHRPGYMDHLSIKRFDQNGQVVGERRFVGLYTSAAYIRSVRDIPLLRKKVDATMTKAGFRSASHTGKALLHILETFPRDELFHIDEQTLFETVTGILQLQERQRIRVFVHRERYGRTYSCLVFIPRRRYNTRARDETQAILEEAFDAELADFSVQLSESALARLYFLLRVTPGKALDVDLKALEQRLHEVTRTWNDDLEEAILDYFGEEEHGMRFLRRYNNAFNAAYQETYTPRVAVRDIEKMESLSDDATSLAMTLYRPLELDQERIRFKLFRPDEPVSLSDALPMLENMGLTVDQESPSRVRRNQASCIWVHDFSMAHQEGPELDLDSVQLVFQEAFVRIWRGEIENDGFNRLVLRAGISWREIVMLRCYAKYMRQIGVTYSQDYMEETLVAHPFIVRKLVQLFHARFHPNKVDLAKAQTLEEHICEELDKVEVLDQDRILRAFLRVILASLRTNYYQSDATGSPKSYLSVKFDPALVPDLPEPRPRFEIFVYSPQVEGVHLRGGSVARGGLRWSDRREDFRTEILGLMKAQMVKNVVIVPVGSKGGFVPKQLPFAQGRDAVLEEAKECYRTFIRGLLDITDNYEDEGITCPDCVVRHDGDDPYLVVAADKGTATFSDIANAIAIEYGFWLGDAFASGGSAGYDHKAMGITARGAWESVKRHFREMGTNTQTTPFTVVGVGDMSGDVFGNGMLLSEQIKLVGAFNHLHIFLDPDPDPTTSFAERKRLFELPRSSWEDYDTSLISKGGGVFSRNAKSIPLTPEIQQVLGVEQEQLTANEVISAILKAPVDLLWNGGIGTYVKASSEHDSDVGDRANDSVRIDADELRCKVVGEGGNLGLTQLGRNEFSSSGGRVHTDAIDNSAGVDCSDHEVNIKILLNQVLDNGDMTDKQRNQLLAEMTDEVGDLVLRNNYLQTQALTLAAKQTHSMIDVQSRLIDALETQGKLSREIEFLPDKVEIEERKEHHRGLTLPELSVLMGYVKLTTYDELLESDLPDAEYFSQDLVDYFPTHLRDRYGEIIPEHRLAREIVCTLVTNEVVNRAGSTFIFRLMEETGATPADIARAFIVARQVFAQQELWAEIEALDNHVETRIQAEMLLEGRKLVERAARWFVRNRPQPIDISDAVQYFCKGVTDLGASLNEHLQHSAQKTIQAKASKWIQAGVPEDLAEQVAGFNELLSALDIVGVSTYRNSDVTQVADVYFALGAKLDLQWLRDQINALPRNNRWQALGRDALRDDLYTQQRAMTSDVMKSETANTTPLERVDNWLTANSLAVRRCRRLMEDLRDKEQVDFTMLSVALRELRGLRQIAASQSIVESRDETAAPKTNGEAAGASSLTTETIEAGRPH